MSIAPNPNEFSSNSPPFVSIIILNYNGQAFIQRCLKTVLEDSYQPKEIILVDNASTDGSLELARPFQEQIIVKKNPRNYGFPKGCNEGIRAARGEIIVLLNVDTAVRPHWLTELIRPFHTDPTIGMVGSKLLFMDGKTIQFAGGRMHSNCLTSHDGYGMPDEGQFDTPQEVDYLTGASVAIRREVLEAVGGLDEGFPLYFEDLDLCYRVRQRGYCVLYQPSSVVFHFETFGTKKNSPIYYYKYHRGRMRFLLKHFGLRYFWGVFLPAELQWYGQCNLRAQLFPLLRAYATQLPKAPFFWIRGWIQRRAAPFLGFLSKQQRGRL